MDESGPVEQSSSMMTTGFRCADRAARAASLQEVLNLHLSTNIDAGLAMLAQEFQRFADIVRYRKLGSPFSRCGPRLTTVFIAS